MMDKLTLQRAPEALHGGIVIAVAFSAHRGLHTELIKQFLVVTGYSTGFRDQNDE